MGDEKNGDLSAPVMSAEDFVRDKVCLCFSPEDIVCEIIEKMRENHSYAVVIIENGKLSGLLTGHDVLVHAAAWRSQKAPSMESVAKAFNVLKAGDVMIRDPVCVDAPTPLDEALRIMMDNGFRYLPVIKEGRPLGVINIIHVAQYMEQKARKDSETKDAVLSYVMSHENYGGVSQD